MSQDSKLFVRGKVNELRAELAADKKDKAFVKRKAVLKKIIAGMTMGIDMSSLFPDIVGCLVVQQLDIKKMCYLFIMNYARSKADMVPFALEAMVEDSNDRNPMIRALAIRTMSYIYLPPVISALLDPLRWALKDADPYVRKTAAICVAKLHAHDKKLVDKEGLVEGLRNLLGDSNPTVLSNVVAALIEISERSDNIQLRLNMTIANRLVNSIPECSEWGQSYILESLMYFVPEEHADAEILAERISVRLQHANSAVILTTIKVILYLMNYMGDQETIESLSRRLSPPLVTLLSSGYEVQYVALRNILLIIQRRPTVLKNEVKVFFCKYTDPIYVKMTKLEIIYRLADERNVEQVLAELQEYSSEVDVDFVRKSVRCIGRLAIKIPEAADRCISTLLELVSTKINYVVQEAVVVIRDIFRRYPNRYERILSTLCQHLDALDTPEAKAAMIWIVGHYADRIENADELLEDFLETFLEETVEVQLALLTATVKLFITRPTAGAELVPKVLKWATEDIDNPDLRDRGFIYWRLLSTDPGAAKDIVLAEKPPISTESDAIDRNVLDRLLLHTGTLASLYHQEPSFIRGAKPKKLHSSPALDPEAKRSFLDTLNLPAHVPPEHIEDLSSQPPSLPPKNSSVMAAALASTTAAPTATTSGTLLEAEESGDVDGFLDPSSSSNVNGLSSVAPPSRSMTLGASGVETEMGSLATPVSPGAGLDENDPYGSLGNLGSLGSLGKQFADEAEDLSGNRPILGS